MTILTIQMLILTTLMACKRPIDNPELVDPVYLDLVSETNAAKSRIASEVKSAKETKDKIAALPPRDSTRGALLRELAMHERNLVQATQTKQYFEVRAEQRKQFAKDAYLKAFEADKPWPNLEEANEYKKIKKLQSASRNWEDRVPKTTRYNRNPAGTEKKDETKAAAASSGGGH